MKTKKISVEYGHGLMEANIEEDASIFIPGETVPDPPYIKEEFLYDETKKSILNPIGVKPISQQVKEGSKITIIFPDRVKGGEQETSHRKIAIKIIIEELYKAGVNKKDILLICSNGLHSKNTKEQIYNILGPDIFNEFWYDKQIINHDSEDYDNLIDLGKTQSGDPVIMNKFVYDSDLAILIGHTQGNPYGGYSGGYKHCSTGITHWKSIASHHVPEVMHREDFTPVNNKSLMRHKFDEIGTYMEEKMGKSFFCIDSVLDTNSRQIEIHSGNAKEVQKNSWPKANIRTYIPFAKKKYDVMIFGAPQFFHYGDGMGTNPVMLLQAISAQVVRHKRVMSDNCVIICAATCNGYYNDELWPYIREMCDIFSKDYNNVLPDINRYGEYFATNEEYIRRYRYTNSFHPFHGFSMISSGHLAEKHTSAIYIVGAQSPGIARSMGLKTRGTIEEALLDAKRKYVGENPNILVLPKAFKTTAVHLCMEDDII